VVSQNRQAAIADRRAQLDLQINLLAEYEITRLLKLQDAIAQRLDVGQADQEELGELKEDVEPEAVLEKLETESGDDLHQKKKSNRNAQTTTK
jgi:uncharacterized membrane protein